MAESITPEKLRFSKSHEWVHLAETPQGRIATIGVSAFAVEALTDLVYIELPAVGAQLRAGEPFGEIESVKAVSDLYSPVEGEVIEVNAPLAASLERLNADPYNAGWMVKVKLTSDAGLSELLDHAAYQKQCAEEGH